MFRAFDRIRIKKVKFLLVILLLALGLRLVHIQILRGEHYNKLADDNYYYSLKLTDEKYQLLDSNGVYLNKKTKYYKLMINRRLFMLNDHEANLDKIMIMKLAIKRVNDDFDLDAELEKGYGDIDLELDEEGYASIKEILKDVKGIAAYSYESIDKSKYWLIENLLSTMYKYENDKTVRKADESLEGQIDSLTKENSIAKAKFKVEKSGYIVPAGFVFPKAPNVNLTLDSRLQRKIKAVMEGDEFKDYSNIGAVLIEASTGKVKALVQKDDTQANINIASIGWGYEVGSTFKLMLGEFGLENKVITENSVYTCQGEKCFLNGKNNPHGSITLYEAIKHSCNDYFIDLANKLPHEVIKSFSENQGYFSKVLNIDQEKQGKFVDPSINEKNDNIALGNSLSNTVQVAASLTAILNEGTFVKPYIIDSISDYEGNVIEQFKTERKSVISKKTADVMKKAMRAAVQSGTGYRANIASIEIGGKTGTSSYIPGSGGNGWFAGYYKQDEKYYILTVMVPELGKLPEISEGYTGGNTAAVVFREIVKAINQE